VDPLSEVLGLLDIKAASPSRFEAGGQWALSFKESQHVKVGAVLAGHIWVTAEGADPVYLAAGDCYLLASGRGYESASDLGIEPADGYAAFADSYPDTTYYNIDDGPRTILAGGAITFDETAAVLLLDYLPPCVRIAADSKRAHVLRPILQMLADETASDTPGSETMRSQLTQILFVQALRTALMSGTELGWLGALTDENIGTALSMIHRQPALPWTVAELAATANMSRSAFALRFRTLVGLPPLDYLARWRIQSAARLLRSTDRTVASIAMEFGYSSESAFSNAFKRLNGCPPAVYRGLRARITGSPLAQEN
jgi:AraC-like DNA-binding protein